MKKTFIFLASTLLAISSHAEQPFKVKLRSRGLIDAALSDYGKKDLQAFYKLEDFRLGFKATYQQYELKADVGMTNKKISIKDFILTYRKKKHVITFGNAYDPIAMDILMSSPDLRFHQSAASSMAFTNGRKVGITYMYNHPELYIATGIYTDSDVNNLGKEENSNAFISTSRMALRKQKGNCFYHIGTAFSVQSQPLNQEDGFNGTNESCGVSSLFNQPLLSATTPHLGTKLRGTAEFVFSNTKWNVQGEYFYNRIHYKNEGHKKIYNPFGAYVQASFLALGKGFNYDGEYALAGRPASDKALEIVARYNYTQMNRSGILGGEESDLSIGANFYPNKYLGIKLNGSYVWVGDHCVSYYEKDLFLIQARLQYVF